MDPELKEIFKADKKASFYRDDMDKPNVRKKILLRYDSWTCQSISTGPTMGYGSMKEMGAYTLDYFDSLHLGRKDLSVLELYAGNCSASLVMWKNMGEYVGKGWVATDLYQYDMVEG